MQHEQIEAGFNAMSVAPFTMAVAPFTISIPVLRDAPMEEDLHRAVVTRKGREHAVDDAPASSDPDVAMPDIDPYELAFLRGGRQEVLTVQLFDLVQRGYLTVGKSRNWLSTQWYLAATSRPPSYRDLTEIERDLIASFGAPVAAANIFTAKLPVMFKSTCAGYRQRLEQKGLLVMGWPVHPLALAVGLLGLALAAPFGLWWALLAGLASMGAGGGVLGLRTARGRKRLKELQFDLRHLKWRARSTRFGVADPLLVLGVAAFGVSILAGGPYDAFAKTIDAAFDDGAG